MNKIQQQYKKRRNIYLILLAILFGILISFRFFYSSGEHQASLLELSMIVALFGIVIAIYMVFRCPKCNKILVPVFSSSWGKLHYCPKCGVELKEKKES